ncbi:MAG: hypothetical protein PHW04_17815 [Candidatus Wallbacteria bacterium]|nr:hypothetical protein [Candidatus Wallbacteria bacterium]
MNRIKWSYALEYGLPAGLIGFAFLGTILLAYIVEYPKYVNLYWIIVQFFLWLTSSILGIRFFLSLEIRNKILGALVGGALGAGICIFIILLHDGNVHFAHHMLRLAILMSLSGFYVGALVGYDLTDYLRKHQERHLHDA